MSYELVWFKRDLRWEDHAALLQASRSGRVRCIYVVEPALWQQPDMARQHFEFIGESLQALNFGLNKLGGEIEIHYGEVVDVLTQIWIQAPFKSLHSHEETGNGFTYARDIQVATWCKARQVVWYEYPQFGVTRRLKDRNHWRTAWESHMAIPQQKISQIYPWRDLPISTSPITLEAPTHLLHDTPQRQRGGRPQGLAVFNSFLHRRSKQYRGGISSPLNAPSACSRLSPYLAWGCISMREVVQKTREVLATLAPNEPYHRAGLQAFLSRLYWHCHFIQKLESEPEIEWRNMHRGYDGLREAAFNQEYFDRLKLGQTGWPMVDACVAMLRETGWLNFRLRAMLVSVAAYPLWLHWRPVGEWLATQFLDYEPGIHWSQLQMQSGTTGINTTRVYNPIKQAQDHDPQGKFVRQWLPAMRQVPDTWLFQPWLMPSSLQAQTGVMMRSSLSLPVVDLAQATRIAKARLHERRQMTEVKNGKQAVIDKHASRKKIQRKAANKSQTLTKQQMGFDF